MSHRVRIASLTAVADATRAPMAATSTMTTMTTTTTMPSRAGTG